jgi:hypothetical protein
MGSLGKPRFVALAEWAGGWVCREAKAVTPPATAWVSGGTGGPGSRAAEAVGRSVRCPDPFYRFGPEWVARRLGPHCSRIELKHLGGADVERVLHGMGAEVANVHAGTPGAAADILRDLSRRPDDWLKLAARAMSEAIKADWQAWHRRA